MKTKSLSDAILSSNVVEVYYKRPLFNSLKHIKSASDATYCFRKIVNKQQIDLKEFFCVLLLNRAHMLIAISKISIGSVSGVEVNTKEIFQLALLTNASSVIIAHNHPSGNLTPSEKDKAITKRIKNALAVLDICLIDHLIITSESFISFAEEGLL